MLFVFLVPTAVITIIAIYASFDIYIKRKARGATCVVFWDGNREEDYELVKLKGERVFVRGDPDDTESSSHVIDEAQQCFRYWPPVAPKFMQVRMPTYYFRADKAEAIDPIGENPNRILSPNMLMNFMNQKWMQATVADAREQAEGNLLAHRKLPLYILIGVGVTIALTAMSVFFQVQSSGQLEEIARILKGG